MKTSRHRAEDIPLEGVQPTRAPEALRTRTLAAARRAFVEAPPATLPGRSSFDRWVERLWGSFFFHAGWVAASLLLIVFWQPIALTPGPSLPAIDVAQSATPWTGVPRDEALRFIDEEGLL